jgi:hypothetical protein
MQDIQFDDLQQEAINLSLNDKIKTIYIEGVGGSGKSAIIKEIASKHNRVKLMAITNSASKNIDGKTIHSSLGIILKVNYDATSTDGLMQVETPTYTDFRNYVVIIDEVSMVGEKFYKDVISKIICKKLILLGDPEQLPPVKDKAKDWGLISDRKITLVKNYRAKNKKIDKIISDFREDGEFPILPIKSKDKFNKESVYIAHSNSLVTNAILGIKGSFGRKRTPVMPYSGCCIFLEGEDIKIENKKTKSFTNGQEVILEKRDKYKLIDSKTLQVWTVKLDKDDNILTGTYNKRLSVTIGDYGEYQDLKDKLASKAFSISKTLKDKYKLDKIEEVKEVMTRSERLEYNKEWSSIFKFLNAPFAVNSQFTTVHKSQRRAYKHVYIEERGMTKQQKYVALSRATHTIQQLKP